MSVDYRILTTDGGGGGGVN